VFKASTVIFPNVAAMRSFEWKDKSGYTYGLHGTPTTYTLEERCARWKAVAMPAGAQRAGGNCQCLAGAAATGDEVLMPDNAYGPSKALAEGELARWGISHRFYDAMHPQDLAAKIGPMTRLVWLEAAGSVTLEFPDLCELVRLCK
jgi:cystathionine beta-lyase